MRMHRLTIALTALNLMLLTFTTLQARSTAAPPVPAILRGRSFELVDARGQVRSRLSVEPGGEVVLRLLDQDGTIRVKLGAGSDGSGLRIGTADRPNTTSITLKGRDGRRRVIRP